MYKSKSDFKINHEREKKQERIMVVSLAILFILLWFAVIMTITSANEDKPNCNHGNCNLNIKA